MQPRFQTDELTPSLDRRRTLREEPIIARSFAPNRLSCNYSVFKDPPLFSGDHRFGDILGGVAVKSHAIESQNMGEQRLHLHVAERRASAMVRVRPPEPPEAGTMSRRFAVVNRVLQRGARHHRRSRLSPALRRCELTCEFFSRSSGEIRIDRRVLFIIARVVPPRFRHVCCR